MPTVTTRPIVDDIPLVETLHLAFDLGNTEWTLACTPAVAAAPHARRRGVGQAGAPPVPHAGVRPLADLSREDARAALLRAGVDRDIDPTVWHRPWTVHIQQIGSGEHATRYLARYVYHVALTNHRLERFAHGRVTFRYTHARTGETRRLTLPVEPFIARFLQHVLPRGFTKVRYYGLLSPTGRTGLERARHLLARHAAQDARPAAATSDAAALAILVPIPEPRACSACGHRALRFVERWRRSRAPPW